MPSPIAYIAREVELKRAYREHIRVLELAEDEAWTRYARLDRLANAAAAGERDGKVSAAEAKRARTRAVRVHAAHGRVMNEIFLLHHAWLCRVPPSEAMRDLHGLEPRGLDPDA